MIDIESNIVLKRRERLLELAQMQKRKDECVKKREDLLGSYTKRMMDTRHGFTPKGRATNNGKRGDG